MIYQNTFNETWFESSSQSIFSQLWNKSTVEKSMKAPALNFMLNWCWTQSGTALVVVPRRRGLDARPIARFPFVEVDSSSFSTIAVERKRLSVLKILFPPQLVDVPENYRSFPGSGSLIFIFCCQQRQKSNKRRFWCQGRNKVRMKTTPRSTNQEWKEITESLCTFFAISGFSSIRCNDRCSPRRRKKPKSSASRWLKTLKQ